MVCYLIYYANSVWRDKRAILIQGNTQLCPCNYA